METLFVALRVALSLGAVLVLLWWLQRRFARGGSGAKGKARSTNSLAVVARQTVGPKASVVVVEHDGHRLLLGVTEQGVNVLHSAEMIPDAGGVGIREANDLEAAALAAADLESTVPAVGVLAAESGADHFARVLAEADEAEVHVQAEPAAQGQPHAPATHASPSARRHTPAPSKLSGSILAADTWKQAAAFVRNGR